jgi:hypothetical protein
VWWGLGVALREGAAGVGCANASACLVAGAEFALPLAWPASSPTLGQSACLPAFLSVLPAGQDSDVLLLERYNWRSTAYLTGGHSGAVRVIAFSPNGRCREAEVLHCSTCGAAAVSPQCRQAASFVLCVQQQISSGDQATQQSGDGNGFCTNGQ